MNDDVVLAVHDLHKTYIMGDEKIEVLKGVDMEVKSGEIVSVVGPSGVGKSTLLHIMGTLDRPTKGRVLIDGVDVFELSEEDRARFRNRAVGFVFQFHHLLPEFTALENVMLPRIIAGDESERAREVAEALLRRVGLWERRNHRPGELSGGEQQRVAVARALANEPKVVLADEPSGNLDPEHGEALYRLLRELSCSLGQTFVIATHNPRLAAKADRAVRLSGGKAVPVSAQDLLNFSWKIAI